MKVKFVLALMAFLASSALASSTSQPTTHLLCKLEEQPGSWVVVADESEGSVLINSGLKFPASFTESSISWQMGLKGGEMFSLSINRYSGGFVMGNAEFPVLRRGLCEKNEARQF